MKTWFSGKKFIIVAAGAILLAFGLYYISRPTTTQVAPDARVVTHSTDTPDETKPDDSYKWQGGPDDPKRITLPTIQTEGYIQNVGVDQNQEIAVPDNIHIGGWFVDSVRPGEEGLSIITGHLDGRNDNGIFINLQNIKKEDVFTVELGDGSAKQFKVTNIITVDIEEAPSVLFSQNPKTTNQLNLITCGGNFDLSSSLYDKRVIVYSELVNI